MPEITRLAVSQTLVKMNRLQTYAVSTSVGPGATYDEHKVTQKLFL
jgi:TPP-dependent trihydroxycyclohexane-1,2-dione (THcHDO) dehydratase